MSDEIRSPETRDQLARCPICDGTMTYGAAASGDVLSFLQVPSGLSLFFAHHVLIHRKCMLANPEYRPEWATHAP